MFRAIFTSIAIFISLGLPAQSFSKLEKTMVDKWENWDKVKDDVFPTREAFSTAFEAYFTHPAFCDSKKTISFFGEWGDWPEVGEYLMNGLYQKIIVSTADDGKLKIYSYDDAYGGSGHGYSNYFQFRDSVGGCHKLVLDSLHEGEDEGFYRIEIIKDGPKSYYVCKGYGTYGRGLQHFAIRIFEIVGNRIREAFEFYPNGEILRIVCNRMTDPVIKIDKEAGIIEYPEYEEDESGFFSESFVKREIKVKE